MIDQHGWSSKDWDELTLEQKAMQIASLQYWSEKRKEENQKAVNQGRGKGRKLV